MTGDPLRNGNPQGAACRCGISMKPASTIHGVDDGRCYRHPEKGTEAHASRPFPKEKN